MEKRNLDGMELGDVPTFRVREKKRARQRGILAGAAPTVEVKESQRNARDEKWPRSLTTERGCLTSARSASVAW